MDWINPLAIALLCAAGILFIFSAQVSHTGNDWQKQIVWTLLGFCTYAIVAVANYKIFLSYAHILYALGIAGLLLARPESPFSVERMGARRWVDLGITTVQPTEAAKIGTLIMASSILARSKAAPSVNRSSLLPKSPLFFCYLCG